MGLKRGAGGVLRVLDRLDGVFVQVLLYTILGLTGDWLDPLVLTIWLQIPGVLIVFEVTFEEIG